MRTFFSNVFFCEGSSSSILYSWSKCSFFLVSIHCVYFSLQYCHDHWRSFCWIVIPIFFCCLLLPLVHFNKRVKWDRKACLGKKIPLAKKMKRVQERSNNRIHSVHACCDVRIGQRYYYCSRKKKNVRLVVKKDWCIWRTQIILGLPTIFQAIILNSLALFFLPLLQKKTRWILTAVVHFLFGWVHRRTNKETKWRTRPVHIVMFQLEDFFLVSIQGKWFIVLFQSEREREKRSVRHGF